MKRVGYLSEEDNISDRVKWKLRTREADPK